MLEMPIDATDAVKTDDLQADAVIAELVDCRAPFLIGVRHHSAAMAKIIPSLLDEFAPEILLLELPPEFAEWIPWLAHPDTVAPVALSGCDADGKQMSFYPFADFSPELAAIRWAAKNAVPIEAFDLSVEKRVERSALQAESSRGLLVHLLRQTESTDSGQLWERLVESTAAGCEPENIRRSGLMFGWALRWNDQRPGEYDLAREAYMRSRIAACGQQRIAAVIGAYHAAALLPVPKLWWPPEESDRKKLTANTAKKSSGKFVTAMIPYTFQQLDERSGYPAGIRDPLWHQRIFEAKTVQECDIAVADLIVSICRELRKQGHPMNAADGAEVLRMARDLAILRGLAVPGRGELIESLQMCLTRGQLFGLGRAVAAAMQSILVGQRFGAVPAELPRCGLAPHMESLLQQLRLPGPESLGQEKRLRLDPLRSGLDRARVVVFEQLRVCQIPYASRTDEGNVGDRESLTSVWDVQWQHTTAATIALAGTRGATLRQAAEGFLRLSGMEQPLSEWGEDQLQQLTAAAGCGLTNLVEKGLSWLFGGFALSASLPQLMQAMHFVDRLVSGHIPGMPRPQDDFLPAVSQPLRPAAGVNTTPLLQAAISRVSGLTGSDEEADVTALLELILWFQHQPDGLLTLEAGQLLFFLRQFNASGSALMQGAAVTCRLLLGDLAASDFVSETGSWVDAAIDEKLRHDLTRRLRGTLILLAPRLLSDPDCLDGIEERINVYSDADFLERLPALRVGFDVMSPAPRKLLLQQLQQRLPQNSASSSRSTEIDPLVQKMWFEADQAARKNVAELFPDLHWLEDWDLPDKGRERRLTDDPHRQLNLLDRWRLILGVKDPEMGQGARRAANALDELYGKGSGEGARGNLGPGRGSGAGDETPWPNTRVWADELGELFGERVREEVLGTAVEKGRAAALAVMNEEVVRPSVELLQTILSMKGSLPESQTEKLRRMARRITDELAKELQTRMAPALMGLSTPRPTRRPNRRLDLRRTVLSNLKTAQRDTAGTMRLVPEEFFFRTPTRKTMDWHLIYVVDVSGSMEASVIYCALTAAIFSALPALSVTFLAFSTEVIDFTSHVEDPLAMLLEVQVGGGTYIWKGLQAARERMKVPARTIVLLVSDFQEGGHVGDLLTEVQAIVDSGAKALGLAALSDDGKPCYHTGIAAQVAGCGMPVAALSPTELARWVGEQIR
jgi:Mg-chelatase subunit ChlD